MPASITRKCRSCGEDRTPGEFRDPGDRLGRPPAVCRECRARDPKLAQAHRANLAKRPAGRARTREYAARSLDEVAALHARRYPDGVKTCPAESGCGRDLPLAVFGRDATRADGLEGVCDDCKTDHAIARAIRRAA